MSTRPSVLIVDDSPAERQLMAQALRAAFPEALIETAAHPRAAKEMCAAGAFDCALIDYNMPDMDGMMLAHQLKTEHGYLATVLTTSFCDEMLAAEAMRSGVSDYIPKSRITTESLQRIVGRSIYACSQSRLIDEQRGEIENFAYALAHDFKQPIRQIITFAMLVGEQLSELDAGDAKRHLEFLRDAAARLGALVDVMSRYTLLNQPPELSDIDLNRVALGVKNSLASLLSERQGEFLTPEEAPAVRGNEILLSQILQNLVINGLRYNRSKTPRVSMSVRRQGAQVIIDVGDNGVGIEAGYLAEIFKPLVRLHTAAEYPGSGLGLTLARKAALVQEGAIWCESTPGGGSVFHVQLPAAPDQPTSSVEPRSQAKPPSNDNGGAVH